LEKQDVLDNLEKNEVEKNFLLEQAQKLEGERDILNENNVKYFFFIYFLFSGKNERCKR